MIEKKTKEDRKAEKSKRKSLKPKSKLDLKKAKPNDKYWRNKADEKFMKPGRGLPCAVCQKEDGTVYHHIIEKSRCRAMRYDLNNVIVLCQLHHCHSNEMAPHSKKSIAQHRWWAWFKKNKPGQYIYCKANEHKKMKYTYKDYYLTNN